MRLIWIVTFICLAWSLPAAALADLAASERDPSQLFTLVSESLVASRAPQPDGPVTSIERIYRYAGDRVVTAWAYSCVSAAEDARTGRGSTIHDAFVSLGRTGLPVGLAPGETVELRFGYEPSEDLMRVQTCGFSALLFDDGSSLGAPEVIESIEARRRQMVEGLREAASALREIERRRESPAEASERLSKLLTNDRVMLHDQRLRSLRQEISDGGEVAMERVRTLREEATSDYSRLLLHLNPRDRAAVEQGEAP